MSAGRRKTAASASPHRRPPLVGTVLRTEAPTKTLLELVGLLLFSGAVDAKENHSRLTNELQVFSENTIDFGARAAILVFTLAAVSPCPVLKEILRRVACAIMLLDSVCQVPSFATARETARANIEHLPRTFMLKNVNSTLAFDAREASVIEVLMRVHVYVVLKRFSRVLYDDDHFDRRLRRFTGVNEDHLHLDRSLPHFVLGDGEDRLSI